MSRLISGNWFGIGPKEESCALQRLYHCCIQVTPIVILSKVTESERGIGREYSTRQLQEQAFTLNYFMRFIISLIRKCNDRHVTNVVSLSIQHVRLPTQRLPIVLFDLQFVKIKAIDGADIDGADDWVTSSRLVDSENTTSGAESVPGRRLFRFIVAAVVPHILCTLDFYGVLLWVETEVSVLYHRVLSDNLFR